MTVKIPKFLLPEVRTLIQVARSYVAGEIHFSYVCNAVSDLQEALKFVRAEPAIVTMAKEWGAMALRVWPEMAQIPNPISESEFLEWIRTQLVVFEPVDQSQWV